MRIETQVADPTQQQNPAVKPVGQDQQDIQNIFHRNKTVQANLQQGPDAAFFQEDPSPEQVERLFNALKDIVNIVNRDVELHFDDTSEQIIIRVVDRATGETIRQIPPQELLDIANRVHDFLGLLLDIEA